MLGAGRDAKTVCHCSLIGKIILYTKMSGTEANLKYIILFCANMNFRFQNTNLHILEDTDSQELSMVI